MKSYSSMRNACLLAITCLFFSNAALASTWETDIRAHQNDNFRKAAFKLWLENSPSKPVALLVIVPGWNGDGRDAVNDPTWRAFAKEQNLGILGVFLQSDERNDQASLYHDATKGSGAALLNALNKIAILARNPEIARLPLLICGHSAGGQFGYGLACHAPDRVIAFASVKGGVYASQAVTKTYGIPGIFIIGENDLIERAMNITWLFESGRRKGAPWCVAYEPNSGHEAGNSQALILPFFAGTLKLRIKEPSNKILTSIEENAGWCGVRSSLSISQVATTRTLNSQRTVWLPDLASARAWVKFSTGPNASVSENDQL